MDYTRQTKNDLEQAKQIVEQHLALDTCVITLNEVRNYLGLYFTWFLTQLCVYVDLVAAGASWT